MQTKLRTKFIKDFCKSPITALSPPLRGAVLICRTKFLRQRVFCDHTSLHSNARLPQSRRCVREHRSSALRGLKIQTTPFSVFTGKLRPICRAASLNERFVRELGPRARPENSETAPSVALGRRVLPVLSPFSLRTPWSVTGSVTHGGTRNRFSGNFTETGPEKSFFPEKPQVLQLPNQPEEGQSKWEKPSCARRALARATPDCFSATCSLEGMRNSPSPGLQDAPETEDLSRGAWVDTASHLGRPLPASCWHLKHVHSTLALFYTFVQEPAGAAASGGVGPLRSRAVTWCKSTWVTL